MNWVDGEYTPRQQRAEDKKERLVSAALQLFNDKGYQATSTREIAEAAGVATGSFYRYFKDKKAIFLAACRLLQETLGGRIFTFAENLVSEGGSPEDLLRAFTAFAIEAHRHHRGFHREVMAMELLDADVAAFAAERDARIKAWLGQFLRAIQDDLRIRDFDVAVELVFLAAEEVAHKAVIFDSDLGEARLVAGLNDMLGRYLLKP